MDIALEPEAIGGALGNRDPDSGAVDLADGLQPRSGGNEIGRLDLGISWCKGNHGSALRLGATSAISHSSCVAASASRPGLA